KKLFETKAISKSELDARIARADGTKASVDGAVAQAGEAAVALQDTVLRAPMDGVVLSRPIEVGALVAPGQHAVSIADVRPLKASFGARQPLVEKLSIGTPLEVYVGVEGIAKTPERRLDATVTRIAPAADTQGRVFSVEADLSNEDGRLRPGSVVSIQI